MHGRRGMRREEQVSKGIRLGLGVGLPAAPHSKGEGGISSCVYDGL